MAIISCEIFGAGPISQGRTFDFSGNFEKISAQGILRQGGTGLQSPVLGFGAENSSGWQWRRWEDRGERLPHGERRGRGPGMAATGRGRKTYHPGPLTLRYPCALGAISVEPLPPTGMGTPGAEKRPRKRRGLLTKSRYILDIEKFLAL